MALTKNEIDKVVNELYDDIFKFCVSKTASIDAAEEITQETFLAFTRKSKDLTNVNLRAWIYKTADLGRRASNSYRP